MKLPDSKVHASIAGQLLMGVDIKHWNVGMMPGISTKLIITMTASKMFMAVVTYRRTPMPSSCWFVCMYVCVCYVCVHVYACVRALLPGFVVCVI
jgi:hypothetical protein